MKNLLKKIISLFVFYFYCTLSFSHELWLEPVNFNLKPNQILQTHIKVGQNFHGEKYPYIGAETIKLNLFHDTKIIQLKHRDGDYPAIQATLAKKGSYILAYESAPELLQYDNFDKFKSFLEEQGLWNQEKYTSSDKISESYTRYAKSIITAGNAPGSDFKTGLLFELVVLNSISNLRNQSDIPVKLYYQDKPYANCQITMFRLFQNNLDIYKIATNDKGEAKIPMKEGGKFLLNAVYFSKNDNKQINADWKSLWASSTFEIIK